MKKWIAIIGIYIVVVGVLFSFIYILEQSFKRDDDMPVQGNMDTTKREDMQIENIRALKEESHKELVEIKDLASTPEYYKCLMIFEEFFEDIEYKDYEAAMHLLSPDFREYKGINSLGDFIKYIEEQGLDKVSCDINHYSKLQDDSIRYKCNIVFMNRYIDTEDYNTEHVNDRINNSKVKYDEATVTVYTDETYDIAFEGFIKYEKGSNISVTDEPNLKINISKIYSFFNGVMLDVEIQNNGDDLLNAGTMFDSIQALDYYDNPVWADELPDSIEYNIEKGQKLNVHVSIDITSFYPKSIMFVLGNEIGGRPIKVDLP